MYSVLIAEDELLVRMGIASSVPWAQLGMRVVSEVADGLSAFQAFEKLRPDIVILDIRMPRMDGLELLERIREQDKGCAAILITNVEHEDALEKARRLGIVDILLKASVKQDDILQAVLKAKDMLIRDHRTESSESEWDSAAGGAGASAGWRRFLLDEDPDPDDGINLKTKHDANAEGRNGNAAVTGKISSHGIAGTTDTGSTAETVSITDTTGTEATGHTVRAVNVDGPVGAFLKPVPDSDTDACIGTGACKSTGIVASAGSGDGSGGWANGASSANVNTGNTGHGTEGSFPGAFSPGGYILLQICPSIRLSHRLEDSLRELFVHRLKTIGSFVTIPLEMGAVALAKENLLQQENVLNALQDLRRFVYTHFQEEMRFVLYRETLTVSQTREHVRKAMRYTTRSELFVGGFLYLDERGLPDLAGYQSVRDRLESCGVISPEKIDPKCVKALEELPEALQHSWEQGCDCADRILSTWGGNMDYSDPETMMQCITETVNRVCDGVLRNRRPQILQAVEYMNSHLGEKLSVQVISQQVGYHPNYLSNLFKQELGMSYSDFLTQLRIRRAKQLMQETDTSLQDIAMQCGFPDLSYFSVKFKKAEGQSPGQWRARQ